MSVIDVGSGPALLFGHGWLASSDMWKAQIGTLSAEYRVIVPDMWGHGLSAAMPKSTRKVSDIASQHLELLDRLEVDQATVVGFSLGGIWGAELAVMAPSRVSALITIASSSAYEPTDTRADFLAVVDELAARGKVTEELSNELMCLFYSKGYRMQELGTVEAHTRQLLGLSRDQIVGTVAPIGRMIFNRRDALADIKSLKIPILTVAGLDDGVLPFEKVRQMAEKIGSLLLGVPEARHMLPCEAPALVTWFITNFLSGSGARSKAS